MAQKIDWKTDKMPELKVPEDLVAALKRYFDNRAAGDRFVDGKLIPGTRKWHKEADTKNIDAVCVKRGLGYTRIAGTHFFTWADVGIITQHDEWDYPTGKIFKILRGDTWVDP